MSEDRGFDSEITLSQRDGYTAAIFRGTYSLAGFQRRTAMAAHAGREGGHGRLYVDMTCFDVSPSVTERYQLATQAVKMYLGLKVAVLVSPTFMDPAKFGIVVANNRGLRVNAFTEEAEALAWLLAPDATS